MIAPGESVTLTYTPLAAFQVSGIQQDFRGANNYRPNVTCDPYAQGDAQTITNWFNRDCVSVPRSRPRCTVIIASTTGGRHGSPAHAAKAS